VPLPSGGFHRRHRQFTNLDVIRSVLPDSALRPVQENAVRSSRQSIQAASRKTLASSKAT
jgi:hypothetical protein